jgi:acyl-CoA-binding protein
MAKMTNEQAALYYLSMRPKLDKAFDTWAAAKPEHADAAMTEYFALRDKLRSTLGAK